MRHAHLAAKQKRRWRSAGLNSMPPASRCRQGRAEINLVLGLSAGHWATVRLRMRCCIKPHAAQMETRSSNRTPSVRKAAEGSGAPCCISRWHSCVGNHWLCIGRSDSHVRPLACEKSALKKEGSYTAHGVWCISSYSQLATQHNPDGIESPSKSHTCAIEARSSLEKYRPWFE